MIVPPNKTFAALPHSLTDAPDKHLPKAGIMLRNVHQASLSEIVIECLSHPNMRAMITRGTRE